MLWMLSLRNALIRVWSSDSQMLIYDSVQSESPGSVFRNKYFIGRSIETESIVVAKG